MPRSLDPATREALAERLRFYRDLGLTDFYRRPVDETIDVQGAPSAHDSALGAPGPSHLGTRDTDSASARPSHAPSIPLGAPGPSHLGTRDTDSASARPSHAPSIPLGAPGPSHLGTRDADSASARPSHAPSIPLGAPGPSHLGTRDSAEWVGDHKSSPADPETAPPNFSAEDPTIKSRKPIHAPEIGAIVPPADRAAALQIIRDEIGDCTRCALHKGRNKLVFADGSPTARLMFVGEGPGADEDAQGLPFVGRAGQLLNNMIAAMGLKREEVYIANVVKCRPPGNRTPEPEEANTCSPFLFRQIDVVHPQVLVALGATAATYLLGQRQPLAGLRGRVHAFRGMSLIVTYHPAFLLRDPRQKKEAWADLQIAMKELGLKAPAKA